jgi:uncharacterized membrane protein YedE/YeeE
MKRTLAALGCGIIFGVGLSLSRMVDPNKVQDFLDITGNWDASLLFVMLGALPVAFIAFRYILRRPAPLLDTRFQLTKKNVVDKTLIGGAVIFGIGWGLSGYCPGPAIAGLGWLSFESVVMVAAIYAGFFSYHWLFER